MKLTCYIFILIILGFYSCSDDNAPAPIDAPPLVESMVPADQAVDISIAINVSISFNEPIKVNTVNNESFMLLLDNQEYRRQILGQGNYQEILNPG